MTDYENTASSYRKVYRLHRHLEFTTFRINNRKIPKFATIGYKVITVNKLNLNDIQKLERRKLESAHQENLDKLFFCEHNYEKNVQILSRLFKSPEHLQITIQNIKNSIYKSEFTHDKKRITSCPY